jgi:predicted O-methyltransferase YrrM
MMYRQVQVRTLRHLAQLLSAQSVVEVGTGSGVGSLWLLDGMIASGTLTSIDDEMEHSAIAKLAFAEAEIARTSFSTHHKCSHGCHD